MSYPGNQPAEPQPAGEHPTPAAVVAALRSTFDSGRTRSLDWRRENLAGLKALVEDNANVIAEALASDLGKPRFEAWLTDVGLVTAEIAWLSKHLERLMGPRRVRTPRSSQPGRSEIRPEPLGVVGVVAPWNYPLQLAIVPAAGAIAAGNAVVIKPSELAAATAELIGELLPRYCDQTATAVVQGGPTATSELIAARLDHLFFTGSTTVGRAVMTAAAQHLTPVTLELGGKSPAIVHRSANLAVAARRLAWGKFLNAGQTCVAPDYVLVDRVVAERLVEELRRAISTFFGRDPYDSPDYGRIVNDRHYERLTGLLGSGRVVVGGESRPDQRYLGPTVLVDVAPTSPVMQEEIFGPILPVLAVADIAEAIDFVSARPKPLALYVFAEEDSVVETVLSQTSSGGVTVNGTLFHLNGPHLPFGGVGESGMGSYHGRRTFETFTHYKPIFRRSSWLDLALGYPPYTKAKQRLLRRLL